MAATPVSRLENPGDGGAWGAPFVGSHGVGHNCMHALEKEMAATPVFLPGQSRGRGSLVGSHLRARTELDTTEAT